MNLALMCPPGSTSDRLYTMSEAGGLAAVLREAGFGAVMVEAQRENPGSANRAWEIRPDPDIIVFVMQWDHQVAMPWTNDAIAALKRAFPRAHLCATGRAATVYCRDLLQRFSALDSVLRGEGEETLVELAAHLQNGGAWQSVAGLALRKNGEIIHTPPRPAMPDLNALPFAAREYLKNRSAYPVVPLYTSRSCYGNCTFCPGKVFREATPCAITRMRSAQHVCDEIEMLVRTYGAHIFYVVDDSFFGDGGQTGRARARKIAEDILSRQLRIRFYIECRVNDVEPALFSLLKQAGLRKVFLGIESGSQSFLDRHRKGTTVAQNRAAVQTLRNLGINCDPGFIFWDPWTTFEELRDTVRFIRETALYTCDARVSIFANRLNIHPGMDMNGLNGDAGITPGVGRAYRIIDPQARAIDQAFQAYRMQAHAQPAPDRPRHFGKRQKTELDLCVMEALIAHFASDPHPGKDRIDDATHEVQLVVSEHMRESGCGP